MQLPAQLHQAIEHEMDACDMASLGKAAAELSERYRAQHSAGGAFMASNSHRLAYLAMRMPGTFAANHAVFSEVRRLMPDMKIESLLDLGAGPGTASWAATEVFGDLKQVTIVEQDRQLIQIGKSMAGTGKNAVLENADWVQADLRVAENFPVHDVVVSSYALGEMAQDVSRQILKSAWAAARVALVIVEPGTMKGFDLIRQLRDDLIGFGGHLVAPCPHQDVCPIAVGDWCHFSQRVGRSSLHRRMKIGTLGYEDEKFSYVVASKSSVPLPGGRVLRHPMRRSGHAHLQLCTGEGIQAVTVTRSDKENWKRVRKTEWGDVWG